jgi:hypothetical protein
VRPAFTAGQESFDTPPTAHTPTQTTTLQVGSLTTLSAPSDKLPIGGSCFLRCAPE